MVYCELSKSDWSSVILDVFQVGGNGDEFPLQQHECSNEDRWIQTWGSGYGDLCESEYIGERVTGLEKEDQPQGYGTWPFGSGYALFSQ